MLSMVHVFVIIYVSIFSLGRKFIELTFLGVKNTLIYEKVEIIESDCSEIKLHWVS